MTEGISAYGHIKRAEIKGALSPDEQEELEGLEALHHPSWAERERIDELWAKAFRDHVAPQMDPLFAYAQEIAAKRAGDSAEPHPGQS